MSRRKLFVQELKQFHGAIDLFTDLLFCCDISFVGGSVRTILTEYKTPIKDFDLCVVVNDREAFESILDEYDVVFNSFGGYKIKLESIDFDVWELKDSLGETETFEDVSFAAHLNFDGIVYDYMNDVLYDEPFRDCVETGIVRLNNTVGMKEDYNKMKSEKYSKLWGFEIDLEVS